MVYRENRLKLGCLIEYKKIIKMSVCVISWVQKKNREVCVRKKINNFIGDKWLKLNFAREKKISLYFM